MLKPLFISLLPSTDVDMGRWLLAHYGVSYKERPHAPVFHVLAMKWWGQSGESYPLFIMDNRKTILPNSIAIRDHFDPLVTANLRLMPDKATEPALFEEIEELQHWARYDIGNEVVNWSYFNLLKYKKVVWPSVTTDVPWYEKLTYTLAFGLVRDAMYKGLKLNKTVAAEALDKIHAGFDTLDARLADGRQYMCGDRLTFADFAVAASLAPMILAQGYHGMLPNQALCPLYMQEVYIALRQRPTGQFIQRMYDQHRPAQLLQV